MDWLALLDNGGAWILALAIGWAVLTGRVRLDREVTTLQTAVAEAKAENTTLRAKIDALNDQLAKNNTALEKAAEAQRQGTEMLASVLTQTSRPPSREAGRLPTG